tara:strand:+ start:1017 stop:1559 length:543 start_codon:yes stop_codon:yes gene_type:complete
MDAKLRAHFKEIARNIVARDRWARKHGVSQNTIGEITTAITQAYVLGQKGLSYADLAGTPHSSDIVDWVTIPPRGRETLESMSFGMSKRLGLPDGQLWNIERVSDEPRSRWHLTQDGRKRQSERTVAHGGVAPLIRMKLLEALDDSASVFQLSYLGKMTCQDYWRRSDDNDPTLPKLSLR